jgi:hypothetical protein
MLRDGTIFETDIDYDDSLDVPWDDAQTTASVKLKNSSSLNFQSNPDLQILKPNNRTQNNVDLQVTKPSNQVQNKTSYNIQSHTNNDVHQSMNLSKIDHRNNSINTSVKQQQVKIVNDVIQNNTSKKNPVKQQIIPKNEQPFQNNLQEIFKENLFETTLRKSIQKTKIREREEEKNNIDTNKSTESVENTNTKGTEGLTMENSYENAINNILATTTILKNSIVITPTKRRQHSPKNKSKLTNLSDFSKPLNHHQFTPNVVTDQSTTTEPIRNVIFRYDQTTSTATSTVTTISTTSEATTTTTNEPTVIPNDPWSMFNFLRNIVKIG